MMNDKRLKEIEEIKDYGIEKQTKKK